MLKRKVSGRNDMTPFSADAFLGCSDGCCPTHRNSSRTGRGRAHRPQRMVPRPLSPASASSCLIMRFPRGLQRAPLTFSSSCLLAHGWLGGGDMTARHVSRTAEVSVSVPGGTNLGSEEHRA